MLDHAGHHRRVWSVDRHRDHLQLLSHPILLGQKRQGRPLPKHHGPVYVLFGRAISTDLAIFALPMPVLASLQMPRKQRALLMLVFSIGGLYVVLHWISPTVKM